MKMMNFIRKKGLEYGRFYAVDDGVERIALAHFFDRGTDNVLDFELEEEEMEQILEFCKNNLTED